jgi:hypothetical protein
MDSLSLGLLVDSYALVLSVVKGWPEKDQHMFVAAFKAALASTHPENYSLIKSG